MLHHNIGGNSATIRNHYVTLQAFLNINFAHYKLKIKVMNKAIIRGNWEEIKGKLKKKYADLTDDDLLYIEGKEDETLGRIQKRLGKSREEVERMIKGY